MENENVIPPQNTIPIRRPGTPPVSLQPAPATSTEEKYPTEVIPLPSKGWFYPDSSPLSTGQIEMRMMTAKEEDILTNQNYIKKNIVFDKLLQSLIVDKSVDFGEILLMDQNAMMIAARRLAYGDKYEVSVNCPKCGEDNEISIDLSKLEDKEVDLSQFTHGTNRFEFTLPYSNIPITFKLLNQKDQEQIELETKQLHKANKEASGDVTIRLKYILTSVNGNTDKNYIRHFVSTMLARDARELRMHMAKVLPNVDTAFNFECSSCSYMERKDVPMTVQFFYPEA